MPKLCVEKLEMQQGPVHFGWEKYIAEMLWSWIMSVTTRTVLSEGCLPSFVPSTPTASVNHPTKEDTSMGLWFHPTEFRLVDSQPTPTPVCEQRKKNMFDDDDFDSDTDKSGFAKMLDDARQWFLNELEHSEDKMLREARDEYIGGECPDSLAEAIKKIQEGDFEVNPGYDPSITSPHSMAHAIRWTSKPADQDAYQAARKTIQEAYRAAHRRLMATVTYGGDMPHHLEKFERTKWKVDRPVAKKELPKELTDLLVTNKETVNTDLNF